MLKPSPLKKGDFWFGDNDHREQGHKDYMNQRKNVNNAQDVLGNFIDSNPYKNAQNAFANLDNQFAGATNVYDQAKNVCKKYKAYP